MRARQATAAIPVIVVLLAGCATAPAEPAGLTAAAVEQILADLSVTRWNALMGDDSTLRRPEVDRVDFVQLAAAPQRWVECLADAGYPNASAVGTGVYLGPAEVDRDRSARGALYVCTTEYPIHPAYNGHLSVEQRDRLFDYWESRLVPCLDSLGYDVHVPSSLREVASIFSEGAWSPYDGIDPGPSGWDFLDSRCPPLDVAVYGTWRP